MGNILDLAIGDVTERPVLDGIQVFLNMLAVLLDDGFLVPRPIAICQDEAGKTHF